MAVRLVLAVTVVGIALRPDAVSRALFVPTVWTVRIVQTAHIVGDVIPVLSVLIAVTVIAAISA
jgi:hypothetical protein